MDEYDYLFVGRQLLSGLTWPTYSYIFGSDISWYLFGFFEKHVGGFAGARVAAILLGGLSLLGCFVFTLQLWPSKSLALLSTLFLAASAHHIFISTLATYDIVSFCFFTWALATAMYTASKKSYRFAVLSAALLSIAIVCKYTTILYLPLIGLFMLYSVPRQAMLAAGAISLFLAAYVGMHFSELSTLYQVQIVGVHSANSTRVDIATRVIQQLSLPLWLWACAFTFCFRSKRTRTIKILLLLLAFSVPMPAYHFYSGNHISLYKHLNYSALFLFPAAAWVLFEAVRQPPSRFRITALLFPVFGMSYLCFNVIQLGHIKNAYPNTTELSRVIERQIRKDNTILSEDPYIFRYLTSDVISQENIKETTWLDNNLDGIHSPRDVKNALWDRKFELVLLTDQIHADKNLDYRHILSQRGYIEIYNQPYWLSNVMTTNTNGRLTLFKRLDTAEHHALQD